MKRGLFSGVRKSTRNSGKSRLHKFVKKPNDRDMVDSGDEDVSNEMIEESYSEDESINESDSDYHDDASSDFEDEKENDGEIQKYEIVPHVVPKVKVTKKAITREISSKTATLKAKGNKHAARREEDMEINTPLRKMIKKYIKKESKKGASSKKGKSSKRKLQMVDVRTQDGGKIKTRKRKVGLVEVDKKVYARETTKKKKIVDGNPKMVKQPVNDSKKQVVDCKENTSLRTRSSPHQLYTAIQGLTKEQKKVVSEIGFGKLLGMKLDGITTKLGFYVVDNFEAESGILKLEKGKIQVSVELIHEMLGIPMGGINLRDLEDETAEDKSTLDWRKRYGTHVTPSELVDNILSSGETDWNFVLDFLMLFAYTMGECNKTGRCKTRLIQNLRTNVKIDSIDWCKFVGSCMLTCKDNWKREDPKCHFIGPLTVLALVYLDGTYCEQYDVERRRPAVLGWTIDKMRRREVAEMKMGGFGLCKRQPKLFWVSKKDSQNEYGNTHAYGVDEDAGASTSKKIETIEAYEKRLGDILQLIDVQVNEFEKTYLEGVNKFNGDEKLNKLKERFDQVIKKDVDKAAGNKGLEEIDVAVENGAGGVIDLAEQESQFWSDPQLEKAIEEATKKFGSSETATTIAYDVPAPTFSLCMTQELLAVAETSPIVPVPKTSQIVPKNSPVAANPINYATPVGELLKCNRRRREVCISNAMKSPYVCRLVDEKKGITAEEKKICNYIFSSGEIDTEEVFETAYEYKLLRDTLATIKPGEWVISNVIDCWTMILNHQERYRSPSSPRRLFCHTAMISDGMFEEINVTNEVLELFKSNMLGVMNGFEKELALRNYDMVFLPMIDVDHYYIICFDIKHKSIDLIDNRVYEEDKLENYDEYPIGVKNIFIEYLKMVDHPAADEMAQQDIQILEMSWRSVKNHTDCGIFTMRHLETYMGDGGRGWQCGLDESEKVQKGILNKLRYKYTSKILMSDANLKRAHVLSRAEEFVKEKKMATGKKKMVCAGKQREK